MKKSRILLPVLSASLLLILGACGDSDVSTGGSGNSVEKQTETTKAPVKEAPKKETGKTVDASAQTVDAVGMKVGLGELKIKEDKISVGINLENTTGKVLVFYPDQGQAVVGDMQLDANMFFTSGKIGGEVQGGVKQDAVIEFLAPEGKKIDVNAIKEVKLIFGDVNTGDYMQNKSVEFTIPVK